jgi:hypothetical protein
VAKITKSDPKSQLDIIAETHQRYRDILVAHRDLLARQDALLAEAKPLNEIQRKQPAFVTQAPKPKPQPIKRHEGAVALIGTLLPEQSAEEISAPAPRPNWEGEGRHREIGRELEAISEALKLLSPELAKARKEYSEKVAAQRGVEYAAIAERIVNASKALFDEILEHYRFLDTQRQNGVAYSLFKPLSLERFQNIDEPSSPLMALVLEAVEKKFVGADKIPGSKMPRPFEYFQGGN